MLIDLMFTNSRRPYLESSRPIPDFFIPPKGILGSDFTSPLTKTMPLSISSESLLALSGLLVHRLAPKPNSLSLACPCALLRELWAQRTHPFRKASCRRFRLLLPSIRHLQLATRGAQPALSSKGDPHLCSDSSGLQPSSFRIPLRAFRETPLPRIRRQ